MLTNQQVRLLERLRVKYPGNRMDKFAIDPRAHDATATLVANDLGLDSLPIMRILDLGSGFGYFLNVVRRFGHVAIGLDNPNPMIRDAAVVLGVSIVHKAIVSGEPMTRRIEDSFGLVSMFGVNLHDGKDYWDAEKYAFLAADIRSRLRPGGAWVIRPNAPVKPGSPTACLMDRDWWQKVAGPDAEISTTINVYFQVTIKWPQST